MNPLGMEIELVFSSPILEQEIFGRHFCVGEDDADLPCVALNLEIVGDELDAGPDAAHELQGKGGDGDDVEKVPKVL